MNVLDFKPKKKYNVNVQISASEAARFIGISSTRLAKLRDLGKGPAFTLSGMRIKYQIKVLRVWNKEHTYLSHAEAEKKRGVKINGDNNGTILPDNPDNSEVYGLKNLPDECIDMLTNPENFVDAAELKDIVTEKTYTLAEVTNIVAHAIKQTQTK